MSSQNRVHSQTSPSAGSADEFLCDLRSRGEGGFAERESVPSRFELAFRGAEQGVGFDDVQVRGGLGALGLRLRLAGLGLVQGGAVGRAGGGGVEVRAGQGAEPGVG